MKKIKAMQNITIEQKLNEIKRLVKEVNLNSKEVFNFKEFLKYTGFSESTAYKLTHSHQIPFHKPTNGALFFFKDEIHDWIRENKVHSEEDARRMIRKHRKNLSDKRKA